MPSDEVLLLVASETFIYKAFKTIHMARTKGKWTQDIVVLVPDSMEITPDIEDTCQEYSIQLRKVSPVVELQCIFDFWTKHPSHPVYEHMKKRPYVFLKYYIFDTWLQTWKRVLYIDSDAWIHGPLTRLTSLCTEPNVLYAHSDAYPSYVWKLKNQFAMELFSSDIDTKYNIEANYFQSTIYYFDTSILSETTMKDMIALTKKYPHTIRADQGITNLWIQDQSKLFSKTMWRQFPVCDTEGFLYDFHERDAHTRQEYLIIKYPIT